MITLNCDMGEAFGLYRMGDDTALMPLIDVANVACGFHASDFNHMRTTVVAELAGTLRHFLVEDEDEVMAGQPLYEIEA